MDRSRAPVTSIETTIPLIKPEEILLDNGLPVYMLHGGDEDIVKVEVVFHAGSYYQQLPLQAFATAHLMGSGTATRNSREISEQLDYFGTYLHVDVQKDISSFAIFMLQKHLNDVLPIVGDIMRNPSFEAEELDIFLKNRKQQHLVNSQKVAYLARSYFSEMLYGPEHPYGYRLGIKDFDALATEDLHAFHQQMYHPANAFCIISGKIPAYAGTLLNDTIGFSGWNANYARPNISHQAKTAAEKRVVVQKPDVIQSAIRVGRRLFNQTHPDHHKLVITNTLLGGYFGSRLMQNIRQEKGYTYGIGSGVVSMLRDGYFFISSETGVNVCQKTLDEIYHELRTLRTIPARDQELTGVKSYLAGDYLRSFDGPFAQSQRYKEILAFRMDVSFFDAFLKELKSITAHQMMQIAEKYLHEDSMMELVVGKK